MMKRLIYIVCFVIALGCSDESFTPPQVFLDSPAFVATQSATALSGGESASFAVEVSDAPAGVDSIGVTTTNGLGEVSIAENGIIGQNKGTFNVTVTMPLIYEGKFDIIITVYDKQVDNKTGDLARRSFAQTFSVEVAFKFDAPQFSVSFDEASLNTGETAIFTVDITDVPGGGIDAIELTSSAGTITYDQMDVDALIGKSSGILTGVYTAGGATTTGDVTVKIRDKTQSRSNTVSEGIVTICPSDTDISGTYRSIAHGVSRDGVEYNAVETTVTFTKANDGQFDVDDRSFGEYTQVRGLAAPVGTINVCGDVISPRDGSFFHHSGSVTVNGSDITIDIDWINDAGDTGIVRLYKL